MAGGYGEYSITPVDINKPLMLAETVRQNRMMEQLQGLKIAKAQQDENAMRQAGQFLPAALAGDKAAQAKLLELSPERGMAVLKFVNDRANDEFTRRLLVARTARAEQLAGRGVGGPGVGGAPVFGGPAAGPVARPAGPAPMGVPSIGGSRRADLGPQAPAPTMMAGAPFADTAGDDTAQIPTGGSGGDEPVPGAPLAIGDDGNIRLAPEATARKPGRETIEDVHAQGFTEFIPRDKYQQAVVQKYLDEKKILMIHPDGRRKAVDMFDPKAPVTERAKPPEDHQWVDPADPRKGVVPITGSRADPAAAAVLADAKRRDEMKNRPLTDKSRTDIATFGSTAMEFDALANTFRNEPDKKDDKGKVIPGVRYGGHGSGVVGDLANTWRRNAPDKLGGGDPTGEAEWWSRYQAVKNFTRHELFGAALTATEKAEFEKAMVNPGMRPEEIQKNLKRQRELALLAASRVAHSRLADGYNKDAIEAALGITLDRLPAATAGVPGSSLARQPAGLPSVDDIEAEIKRRGLK